MNDTVNKADADVIDMIIKEKVEIFKESISSGYQHEKRVQEQTLSVEETRLELEKLKTTYDSVVSYTVNLIAERDLSSSELDELEREFERYKAASNEIGARKSTTNGSTSMSRGSTDGKITAEQQEQLHESFSKKSTADGDNPNSRGYSIVVVFAAVIVAYYLGRLFS